VIRAIENLKADINFDIEKNADYLRNEFTTVDGFQVGYYISEGKATWFIRLEKVGSDSFVYFGDVKIIEAAFTNAKNKIEELRGHLKF